MGVALNTDLPHHDGTNKNDSGAAGLTEALRRAARKAQHDAPASVDSADDVSTLTEIVAPEYTTPGQDSPDMPDDAALPETEASTPQELQPAPPAVETQDTQAATRPTQYVFRNPRMAGQPTDASHRARNAERLRWLTSAGYDASLQGHEHEGEHKSRKTPRGERPTSHLLSRGENEQILTYTKLLTTFSLLLFTIAFLVYLPAVLTRWPYITGLGIVIASSVLALVVPWGKLPAGLASLVDLATIVGVVYAASAIPGLGVGLLLVLPVISLVWSLRALGTILGPSFSAIVIWIIIGGPPRAETVSILIVIPLYLALVALVAYLLSAKNAAHTQLIQNQAQFLAEAAIATDRQERIMRDLFDAVDVGIVAMDAQGNVIIENTAMRRLIVATGIEMDKANEFEAIYQADGITPWPQEDHPARAFLRRDEWEEILLWARATDGTMIALEVTYRHLYTSNGESYLSCAYFDDVTASVLTERAKSDLIRAASTDIEEPFRALRAAVARDLDAGKVAADRIEQVTILAAKADDLLNALALFNAKASDSTMHQLTEVRGSLIRAYRCRAKTARDHGIEIVNELGNPFFVRLPAKTVESIAWRTVDLAFDIAAPNSIITITSPSEFGESSFAVNISTVALPDWMGAPDGRETYALGELRHVVLGAGGEFIAENRGESAHLAVGFSEGTQQI